MEVFMDPKLQEKLWDKVFPEEKKKSITTGIDSVDAYVEKAQNFISSIVNGIALAIVNNDISVESKIVACEKCGAKDCTEYKLSKTITIAKLFFVVKKTLVMRAFYHEGCGCLYFRFNME